MTPFVFGSSGRRLFGAYEPALIPSGRARAAVLCAPWGDEYLHAHRSLRRLARLLTEASVHTLRFDYFGTGDSGGEIAEASLAGSEDDVLSAVEELRAITDARTVELIGLRLGANIALKAAQRLPGEIDGLALWDPILDGSVYCDERRAARTWRASKSLESCDFGLTEGVVREIETLDFKPSRLPPRVLVVCTAGDPKLLCRRFSSYPGAEINHVPSTPAWLTDWPRMMMPVEAIQRIVDWAS